MGKVANQTEALMVNVNQYPYGNNYKKKAATSQRFFMTFCALSSAKGMDIKMNISDFIEKNDIAILAKADLGNQRFDIIKKDVELESYDLFEQLILFNSVENLMKSLSGQLLPRIWTQGNTKCVICQPNDEQIVALFYDNCMDAKDNYFYAKQLDSQLKELF